MARSLRASVTEYIDAALALTVSETGRSLVVGIEAVPIVSTAASATMFLIKFFMVFSSYELLTSALLPFYFLIDGSGSCCDIISIFF